ncbi:putative uncharacterized protein [Waddlia chondrophila 2032/99]|uniref:Uncharacterized protein n=2 Tax=Waddlia chondrophila TaxID=71667 RepID=D6YRJ2_WADCW|nr:hypothetical protein [Waddlia chondrophila]ADI38687.1 hypothetical protein wcw_1335 [Waddlia chondrophila WSU 86-1044]CCB90920.1 putative uncharacterized protein [Waddlia chondrophila 2032/99]
MITNGKAPESYQVQKARRKLLKQMEAENKQINEKAIDQMKKAIHIWIDRHQSERIALQDRPIRLFDENSHPAKTKSKFVNEMLCILKDEKEKEVAKSLAGRIKTKSLPE